MRLEMEFSFISTNSNVEFLVEKEHIHNSKETIFSVHLNEDIIFIAITICYSF